MVETRYDMAVFVMGMHRSGTSALARVLMLLYGDSPTQLLDPNSANPLGFWEAPRINAVNQALLADRGTNWHGVSALGSHGAAANGEDFAVIRSAVADMFPNARRPVIKDPRICRLAPLWIEALRDQTSELAFPFILRNPSEVAISLSQRNRFPHALGLNLWLRHYLDAENATRAHKRGLVRYDALLADWRTALHTLHDHMEMDFEPSAASGAIDAFLTPDLHRQNVSREQVEADFTAYPMVSELWDLLNEWSAKGRLNASDIGRMDRLRGDFDRVAPLMDTVLEQQRVQEKRRIQDKKSKLPDEATPLQTLKHITQLRKEHGTAMRSLEDGMKAVLADLAASRQAEARIETIRQEAEHQQTLLRGDHAREIDALKRMVEGAVLHENDWRARANEVAAARDAAVQQAEMALSRLGDLAGQLQDIAAIASDHDDRNSDILSAEDADAIYEQAQPALAVFQDTIALARGLEADINASRSELLDAVHERDEAKESLGALRAELSEIQDELTVLREGGEARLDVAERERAAAQNEASALREEIAVVRSDLKSVTRKYRTTQATLSRTKAGLDKAKVRLTSLKELSQRNQHELEVARANWAYRFAQALALLWMRMLSSAKAVRSSTQPRQRDVAGIIAGSGLFDAAWYLERYPDVAKGSMPPLEHFARFGWKELRDPGPDFSASRYLRENPDVAQAGLNPVVHYIENGQLEGRSTHKSKLAHKPAQALPVFAAPAPVHACAAALELPLAVHQTDRDLQPSMSGSFAAVAAACETAPDNAAALARFLQLSGLASYDADAWRSAERDAFHPPADAWFANGNLLRLRCDAGDDQDASFQVLVCQYDPGAREPTVLSAGKRGHADLLDVPLRSLCHPLLVAALAPSGELLYAFVIAFPSLMRGGMHHADFLSEIARPGGSDANNPLAYSVMLAKRLAAIRCGAATPAIARIAVEVKGAVGTGPLFDPAVRTWLRDVFDMPIVVAGEADAGDRASAGEMYLRDIVAQTGTLHPAGATLFIHGDVLPSVSILCATLDVEETGNADVNLALPEALVHRDASLPSFAFILPPVALQAPAMAAPPHFRGHTRMEGQHIPRRPMPPASIAVERGVPLHDAELLFPVSAAETLTDFRPRAVRVMIFGEGADTGDIERSLASLAMQDCAEAVSVSFIGVYESEAEGGPGSVARERAGQLFGGRVAIAESLSEALANCDEPFCGILAPGIVLHDGRSLSVLSEMVENGAASACCPLVSSSRLGKGWTVKVAANGLSAETPRGSHVEGDIAKTVGLWRRSYPVREPIPEFWLTDTAKLTRWSKDDVHQLPRDDGEHWCTALTTASITGHVTATTSAHGAWFEAPIADSACFTAVRVLNG
ncbi:sulfotransferase [Novosphingobium sp. P6W]|uniref:sulfotransferase n=1 Tax=Novosphingobium sp. P6W TaxID=1609758 RepID=UPI000AF6B521|nr:sulfotransferase [Novosphingobium sp. P6W]